MQRIEPSKLTQELLHTLCFSAVVHLTLRPHAVPGQAFEVFIGTQTINVTCPMQFKEGDTVRINVPAFPVSPLSTEEEKGKSQVRTFVHTKEKRLGYMVTVPPGVKPGMRFPVKIDGQKEFCVPCTIPPAQGDSRESVGRLWEELYTGMIYDRCKCKRKKIMC
jgi:hypothetical protein